MLQKKTLQERLHVVALYWVQNDINLRKLLKIPSQVPNYMLASSYESTAMFLPHSVLLTYDTYTFTMLSLIHI